MRDRSRKTFISAVLAATAFLGSRGSQASVIQSPGQFASKRAANLLLSQTFPTNPMKVGRLNVKAVPTYLSYSKQENYPAVEPVKQSLTGAGLAVSLDYTALENDWGRFGFGFLGVYFRQKGDKLGFVLQAAGQPTVDVSGDETSEGAVLAATGNWDPTGKDRRFHLPMIFGFSYQKLKDKAAAEGPIAAAYGPPGASGTYRAANSHKINSPGVLFGISPQFEAGRLFRISPFGIVSYLFKDQASYNTLVNTATGQEYQPFHKTQKKLLSAVGVNLTYIPWNLGATLIPPLKNTDGQSAYSLTLSHSFGGEKPE